MIYVIHTDGGARGNPGPAAIGVVIEKTIGAEGSTTLKEFGKTIGVATNNVAEYTAVIEALHFMHDFFCKGRPDPSTSIQFVLDSQLVVQQLRGMYKVKEHHLQTLHATALALIKEIGIPVTYISVPREQNKRADFFVNHALDSHA